MLSSVIAALRCENDRSRLFVGSDGSGCLDQAGIETQRYWYRRTHHRLLTLATYLASQLMLLIKLFRTRSIDRDAVIYVNTLLPFGAAIYGWMTRRRVIYHLHEVSISPTTFRWFLITVARCTAHSLIYVSDFHRTCLPIRGVSARTIHNALDNEFIHRAALSFPYRPRRGGSFRVLMLASLRDYKGVPEFVTLAKNLSDRDDITFHLVANDDGAAIKLYFADLVLPGNLRVYPRTDDPALHYAEASLVVNLSRPDLWQETFGLTLLESMVYGIPVIAPPVGGSLELVSEGHEGFLVDCRHASVLAQRVKQLADDPELCMRMSAAARKKAGRFSPDAFGDKLKAVLREVRAEGFAL